MRLTKWAVLLLAATACIPAPAKKGKKKATKVEAVKLDTCSIDTLSYALGMANTQGLMGYLVNRMGMDTLYMADFMDGFYASLTEEEGKKVIAYSTGYQIRQQVETQIIPGMDKRITDSDSLKAIKSELFVDGFAKALTGDSTVMTVTAANELSNARMKQIQEDNMERKYGDNRRAGEAFLKENATKDSVQTFPSGVQYKILVQGEGKKPLKNSKVKVNYEGRLVDGTVFDSSYERKKPSSFVCNKVIKGWTEALTNMPVGSKWEIYIPQELGYGSRESGKIPPYSALIFTVELLEIEK